MVAPSAAPALSNSATSSGEVFSIKVEIETLIMGMSAELITRVEFIGNQMGRHLDIKPVSRVR